MKERSGAKLGAEPLAKRVDDGAAKPGGFLVRQRPLGGLEGEVEGDGLASFPGLLPAVDVEHTSFAKEGSRRLARRFDERTTSTSSSTATAMSSWTAGYVITSS